MDHTVSKIAFERLLSIAIGLFFLWMAFSGRYNDLMKAYWSRIGYSVHNERSVSWWWWKAAFAIIGGMFIVVAICFSDRYF